MKERRRTMPTVTVPRAHLTTEEVVSALKDGLGDNYNVLPGKAMGRTMYQGEHEGQQNQIVVGTGGNRLTKAQVTITSRGGQTELRISPGGITWDYVYNTFGIARKVQRVLASSPTLSAR
jgi:hypothetical protein